MSTTDPPNIMSFGKYKGRCDDYPAVLRQMKANGSDVLLIGDYVGTGATREQFIKTFATASKRVVFLHDVDETKP